MSEAQTPGCCHEMSRSVVSNTDLFLSKPYHQPVNSWLKKNLETPSFTPTNVRGIHDLAKNLSHFSKRAKWKKFLNSECLTWLAVTAYMDFKGNWPLSCTFTLPEYDLDWLSELMIIVTSSDRTDVPVSLTATRWVWLIHLLEPVALHP